MHVLPQPKPAGCDLQRARRFQSHVAISYRFHEPDSKAGACNNRATFGSSYLSRQVSASQDAILRGPRERKAPSSPTPLVEGCQSFCRHIWASPTQRSPIVISQRPEQRLLRRGSKLISTRGRRKASKCAKGKLLQPD